MAYTSLLTSTLTAAPKTVGFLDVAAEGVSMALTLRSEYASVIKRSGGRVEGLVAQLHENIE